MKSIAAIADHHKISDAAIHNMAKRENWGERDLAPIVRHKVRQKLVREKANKPDADDAEIIEAAANEGFEVIKSHRKDISKLQKLEQTLLSELSPPDGKTPTKPYITQFRGEICEHEVNISVTEKASALRDLANAQHKRIQLERQAHGLNDEDAPDESKKTNINYEAYLAAIIQQGGEN
jgi:hypothetical protein